MEIEIQAEQPQIHQKPTQTEVVAPEKEIVEKIVYVDRPVEVEKIVERVVEK